MSWVHPPPGFREHDFSLKILPLLGMHWTIDPAPPRQRISQRIRPVSTKETISGLEGRLALAEIGPTLIGVAR